jgi:hypothetical protein
MLRGGLPAQADLNTHSSSWFPRSDKKRPVVPSPFDTLAQRIHSPLLRATRGVRMSAEIDLFTGQVIR